MVVSVSPIMDGLHRRLTEYKKNEELSKAIRHKCEHGINVLDKCYSKTDDGVLY
jgi:predicted oxidoreductase